MEGGRGDAAVKCHRGIGGAVCRRIAAAQLLASLLELCLPTVTTVVQFGFKAGAAGWRCRDRGFLNGNLQVAPPVHTCSGPTA